MHSAHRVMLFVAVCLLAVMVTTAATAANVARTGREKGAAIVEVTADPGDNPIHLVKIYLMRGKFQTAAVRGGRAWSATISANERVAEFATTTDPVVVGGAALALTLKVSGAGRATWETYDAAGNLVSAYTTPLRLKGKL